MGNAELHIDMVAPVNTEGIPTGVESGTGKAVTAGLDHYSGPGRFNGFSKTGCRMSRESL